MWKIKCEKHDTPLSEIIWSPSFATQLAAMSVKYNLSPAYDSILLVVVLDVRWTSTCDHPRVVRYRNEAIRLLRLCWPKLRDQLFNILYNLWYILLEKVHHHGWDSLKVITLASVIVDDLQLSQDSIQHFNIVYCESFCWGKVHHQYRGLDLLKTITLTKDWCVCHCWWYSEDSGLLMIYDFLKILLDPGFQLFCVILLLLL
jgi:hypothetical protein